MDSHKLHSSIPITLDLELHCIAWCWQIFWLNPNQCREAVPKLPSAISELLFWLLDSGLDFWCCLWIAILARSFTYFAFPERCTCSRAGEQPNSVFLLSLWRGMFEFHEIRMCSSLLCTDSLTMRCSVGEMVGFVTNVQICEFSSILISISQMQATYVAYIQCTPYTLFGPWDCVPRNILLKAGFWNGSAMSRCPTLSAPGSLWIWSALAGTRPGWTVCP